MSKAVVSRNNKFLYEITGKKDQQFLQVEKKYILIEYKIYSLRSSMLEEVLTKK